MKKNSTRGLFFIVLITSTLIVVSSSNWLSIWMGLEINLMSFIPLMFMKKNSQSSQACMLYFLIQSMSSVIMLMTILINSILVINNVMNEFMFMILSSSILMKLGAAPFHQWFPEILSKMNWSSAFLLLTWQKIAPMIVLSYLIENLDWITIVIMSSTIIGAIGGLNQTSLRKIMAYSSISHMGWMMACMKFENELWMMYLIIYSAITLMLTTLFYNYSAFYMNQLQVNMNLAMKKWLMTTLFLSLGGLPPFIGFFPKWIVIQSLINKNLYFMLMIMILSALITLYYYIRIMSANFLLFYSINKWNILLMNKNYYQEMIMMMINLSLPMMLIIKFM
uniref:NADH-ubiquinone oxidoreductase chain 2 n=1 Tax=Nerthra indica TaxID=1249914 RepID=C5HIL1_9HEMI|nr:NADH dehydrogenase subunit 2 [Nerthra indica]ACJ69456.1 NADH dehydrogenase subunit 2 [Nerthra indica]